MAVPARSAGTDDDRHPIRYLNDGVSQDLFVDDDGNRPRLAFPTPSRRAVFHRPPAHGCPRTARRRLPVGAEHRSAATPVAHHDQDRQGRQAQQARQRTVRRDPSRSTPQASTSSSGQPVELTSRRGRAVLPAVITDRVRPGNCFVPFHWNDEHGEYLAHQRRHQRRRRPRLAAARVQGVRRAPAPREVGRPPSSRTRPRVAGSDADRRRKDLSRRLLSRYLPAGVAVCRCCPPRAGCDDRCGCGSTACSRPVLRASQLAPADEPDTRSGPLVLWASQTGNAEEFAARLAERLGGAQLVNMDDTGAHRSGRRAVTSLIVTSTFGDGGPPDNGADFWDRLEAPDAPAVDGVRYAVLGIGDRSYDNFCGHAKSLDGRLTDLGATQAGRPHRVRGLRRRADGAVGGTGHRRWSARRREPSRHG